MNFFCTCGRGTEIYAATEANRKFSGAKVTHRDGKVFVSLASLSSVDAEINCTTLLQLKMVERLFVNVLHSPNFVASSAKQVTSELKSAVQNIGYENWYLCLKVCRKLRLAAQAIQCDKCDCLKPGHTVHTPYSIQSVKCGCLQSGHTVQVTGCVATKSVEDLSIEKETVTETDLITTCISDLCEPLPRKCTPYKHVEGSENTTVQQDRSDIVGQPLPSIGGELEFIEKVPCLTDNGTDVVKASGIQKLSTEIVNSRKRPADAFVTFRVSAKCSGQVVRYFNSQSLSRFLGCQIACVTGWKPELRKPELEIYAQLNHQGLVIGFPINSIPLSCRPYLLHAGLRTTIASIMASLANIEAGFTILDPMCGEATILIEAVKQNSDVLCIGCDNNLQQCARAVANTQFADESHCIHILQADVALIPLKDASVDAVICDLPFGLKHSSVEAMRNLLPRLIASMDRILKDGSRVVLLIGAHLKDFLIGVINGLNVEEDSFGSRDDNSAAPCITYNLSSSHQGSSYEQQARSRSLHLGDSSGELRKASSPTSVAVADQFSVRIENASSACCREGSFVLQQEECSSERSRNGRLETNPGRVIWTTDLVHYVKLGEMDAYICCFVKHC